MKKITLAARILLGLIFFVFGLNGFFHFIPMQPIPEAGMKFVSALMETGYMMTMVKGLEVIAGALLLLNLFVPLALLILAPIVVNIFLFHTILVPAVGMPIVIVILGLIVAYSHKEKFSQVLKMK